MLLYIENLYSSLQPNIKGAYSNLDKSGECLICGRHNPHYQCPNFEDIDKDNYRGKSNHYIRISYCPKYTGCLFSTISKKVCKFHQTIKHKPFKYNNPWGFNNLCLNPRCNQIYKWWKKQGYKTKNSKYINASTPIKTLGLRILIFYLRRKADEKIKSINKRK